MPALETRIALPPRYRVVRHIANGGMASVWAAEDEVLKRLVAVKVLSPGYAADPDYRRRFMREARAAARVSDHPNVITVYDIGEHDGQAFIVMEHFAGGTVAERLRRGEPVPPPTAVRWLGEAASALDAAHAADVVHRDVKPGNFLLDDRGRLAVGDFGIASLAGETALTQAGQVLGTAAYLSPEQARGEPATAASDRYSLAVVAYELLCGRRPFAGDTPAAQARARLETEPPAPDGPCAAAEPVLRAGLAREPAARPPTASAFVEDLRRALGTLAQPARADETATTRVVQGRRPAAVAAAAGPAATPAVARAPLGPPAPPPPRRGRGIRRAPLVAAALGCIAAAVALAALTGGEDPQPVRDGSSAPAERRQAERDSSAERRETTTPSADAAQADGRSPSQLNDEGFALINAGRPQEAVPLLQRAVQGFRDSNSTGAIGYAYALYNLGWALRLSGRPAEAIPYLEERLRVSDFKRDVVERELALARQQAGAGQGDGDDAVGKGKGKGKSKDAKNGDD